MEKDQELNDYEKLMINELKIISEALIDISKSLKVTIYGINYSKNQSVYRLGEILYSMKEKH